MIEELKLNNKNIINAINLINNKKYLKIIQEINNKYYPYEKVKYKYKIDKYSSKDLWAAIKISRLTNYNFLKFGKYTFSFTKNNFIEKILHEIDLEINGNKIFFNISEENKNKYLLNSLIEEAIISSKIEGAVTSINKAKNMLLKDDKPRNKSETMIYNNYMTIKYLSSIKYKKLDLETFLKIHELISFNTIDKKYQGSYRKSNDISVVNNQKNEVVYYPPDFKEIPGLLENIFSFFNNDDEFIHPILKGIILHFLIAFVHPFVDGNGRVARSIFYYYLLSKSYTLVEYLSISKIIKNTRTQYEKSYLYVEKDNNDLTYFLNYNLKVIKQAYNELKRYIEKKEKEKKDFINFQKINNINSRQAEILQLFYQDENTILTTKEVQKRFSTSNQTARNDLEELVKLQYIEKINENKKKYIFIKSSKFNNLINKL